MWYLIFAQLFSSLVKQYDFVGTYRITIGFIYVNPIDALVYSTFALALIFPTRGNRSPSDRVHPMMYVIITLLLIGGLFGWILAAVNGNPAEWVLRQARDHFAWPACIFAGYRLLPNPRSAWKYMYVLGIGGLFTATMTILNFFSNTDTYASGGTFNDLRTVQFQISYAGMGAALFTYSVLCKPVKMLPRSLAVILAIYCLIGQFAPLSRGEWLEGLACVISLLWLVPSGERLGMMVKGLGMLILMLASLYGAAQLVGVITHKDFAKTMNDRIISLLPGQDVKAHAWDSRVGSIQQELQIWMKNPIFGMGFEAQLQEVERGAIQNTMAYFHNGWSSQLATTGIFGFAGFMCIIGTMFVVGRRLSLAGWNRGSIMMGAYCFAGSVYLIVLTFSSMIWNSRTALLFGVVCGMTLRLRDIQLTEARIAAAEQLTMTDEEQLEAPDGLPQGLPPLQDAFF